MQKTKNQKNTVWELLITLQMFSPISEDKTVLPLIDYNENMLLKTNALFKTRDIFLIRGKIN